jgi:hypothetical protein
MLIMIFNFSSFLTKTLSEANQPPSELVELADFISGGGGLVIICCIILLNLTHTWQRSE